MVVGHDVGMLNHLEEMDFSEDAKSASEGGGSAERRERRGKGAKRTAKATSLRRRLCAENVSYVNVKRKSPLTLLASVQTELLAVEDMPHEMNTPRSSPPKQLNFLKERPKVPAIERRLVQRRFAPPLLPVAAANLLTSSGRPRRVGERVGLREEVEVGGILGKR